MGLISPCSIISSSLGFNVIKAYGKLGDAMVVRFIELQAKLLFVICSLYCLILEKPKIDAVSLPMI